MQNANFQEITPTTAELWLNMIYENQRPLRMRHVNFLSSEMKRGRFSPTVTIFFCVYNGKSHLVNGQHTLNAIKESGVTQNLIVAYKTVDTEKELSEMYLRYDINAKRTLKDAILSLNLPDIYDLGSDHISKVCTACAWMYTDFSDERTMKYHDKRVNLSHQDKIDLAQPWLPYSKKIADDVISPCSAVIRNAIFKKSVLPVALLTTKYKPDDSYKFWKQVAQNDGLNIGDPRRTLHEWLLSHYDAISAKAIMINPNGFVHPNVFSRAVNVAWNKFMGGSSIKVLQVRDYNSDISLVGINDKDIKQYVGSFPSNGNY